jgi:CheY-like chemotaxis protein
MPRDVERGLAAGFARYLTKPIEVDKFTEAIDSTLAQLRPAAGMAAERTGA